MPRTLRRWCPAMLMLAVCACANAGAALIISTPAASANVVSRRLMPWTRLACDPRRHWHDADYG